MCYGVYESKGILITSSDAGDGVFRLQGSTTCLPMHWLLKSPVQQQTWYWLRRTDTVYCCSRLNCIKSSKIEVTIQNVNICCINIKQLSLIRVKTNKPLQHSLDSFKIHSTLVSNCYCRGSFTACIICNTIRLMFLYNYVTHLSMTFRKHW